MKRERAHRLLAVSMNDAYASFAREMNSPIAVINFRIYHENDRKMRSDLKKTINLLKKMLKTNREAALDIAIGSNFAIIGFSSEDACIDWVNKHEEGPWPFYALAFSRTGETLTENT